MTAQSAIQTVIPWQIAFHVVNCKRPKLRSEGFSPAVLTSPSLSPPAVRAAWAPPWQLLTPGCIRPSRGTVCAEPGESWWSRADTGRCWSRGAPPAGPGSTFHLLSVGGGGGEEKGNVSEDQMKMVASIDSVHRFAIEWCGNVLTPGNELAF